MKPRRAKLAGEVILVFSFLVQTLLFDYYNEKSNDLDKAYTNQSLLDKGAELKELKYFTAQFSNDTAASTQYQALNINMAAKKIALSQMMAVIGSEKTEQEQKALSNLLMQKASRVNNFSDYMMFIDFVNKNSLQVDDILINIESINKRKNLWRKVFIGLYIIGTVFLIYSIRSEKG